MSGTQPPHRGRGPPSDDARSHVSPRTAASPRNAPPPTPSGPSASAAPPPRPEASPRPARSEAETRQKLTALRAMLDRWSTSKKMKRLDEELDEDDEEPEMRDEELAEIDEDILLLANEMAERDGVFRPEGPIGGRPDEEALPEGYFEEGQLGDDEVGFEDFIRAKRGEGPASPPPPTPPSHPREAASAVPVRGTRPRGPPPGSGGGGSSSSRGARTRAEGRLGGQRNEGGGSAPDGEEEEEAAAPPFVAAAAPMPTPTRRAGPDVHPRASPRNIYAGRVARDDDDDDAPADGAAPDGRDDPWEGGGDGDGEHETAAAAVVESERTHLIRIEDPDELTHRDVIGSLRPMPIRDELLAPGMIAGNSPGQFLARPSYLELPSVRNLEQYLNRYRVTREARVWGERQVEQFFCEDMQRYTAEAATARRTSGSLIYTFLVERPLFVYCVFGRRRDRERQHLAPGERDVPHSERRYAWAGHRYAEASQQQRPPPPPSLPLPSAPVPEPAVKTTVARTDASRPNPLSKQRRRKPASGRPSSSELPISFQPSLDIDRPRPAATTTTPASAPQASPPTMTLPPSIFRFTASATSPPSSSSSSRSNTPDGHPLSLPPSGRPALGWM